MRVNEGIFRDMLRLIIWYPFRYLILMLPLRLALRSYALLGALHYHAGKGKKAFLERVFRQCGVPSDKATVRKYFENHYLDRLHIFLYGRIKRKEQLEGIVRFEGLEILEKARAEGRGVLIVQPHFGPVQITLLALALHGFNPIQIGYPTDKGLSFIGRHVAFRLRLRYEGMLPVPIISADKFLGPIFKHLGAGGVVLTTGDGAGGGVFLGKQIEADFLGQKRLFPLGPADLALRTGALFVPTFIHIDAPDRFTIRFRQPIAPLGNDANEDKRLLTDGFINAFSQEIAKAPQLWHFWDEIKEK